VTKRQQALLARLEEWFDADASGIPNDAANVLNIPIQAVEAIIKLGIHEQRLIRVGDRIMTPATLDRILTSVRSKVGSRAFHPREWREALGYSRQWSDQLAETLESKGVLVKAEGGWKLEQSP
jgi:hypothetical protein